MTAAAECAVTAPEAAGGAVLGTVIGRRCGLPVRALDVLLAPRTTTAVDAATAAAHTTRALAPAALAELHAAVPGLDDVPLRRAALALRRVTGRDPLTALRPTDHRAAQTVLAARPDLHATAQWWQARSRVDDAAEAARAAFAEEDDPTAVLDTLRRPDLLRSLAFASAPFAGALLRRTRPADLRPGTRLRRTATSYLARTALKPSPFAALAAVGVPGAAPGAVHRTTFRPLATTLWQACLSDPRAWTGTTHPFVEPERVTVGARTLSAYTAYGHRDGIFFRHDEQVEVDDVPPAPTADPQDAARAVLTGAIHPHTPWAATDDRHLQHLADRVRGTALPAAVQQSLTDLAGAERRLCDASDSVDVLAADAALHRGATAVLTALGRPVPAWLPGTALAHETITTAVPPVGRPDRWDRLADLLRAQVRVSATYPLLVERFAAAYGVGGRTDLLTFTHRVLDAMENAAFVPPTGPQDPADLPRGRGSLARPASAVFVQELPDGSGMVVNKVSSGHLGTLARWARLPGPGAVVDEAVARAAQHRHPGCRLLQFTVAGDWTDVQRPTCSLPRVAWGADRADRTGDALPLAEIDVRHDAVGGTLQFEHRGEPVALVYTGAIPPFLLGGIAAVLCLLSDPWVTRLRPPAGPRRTGSAIVHGRWTDGDLVLGRARWVVRGVDVPRWEPGSPVADLLLRFDDWRRALGLPPETFVTVGAGPGRKPAWLSVRHPDSVLATLHCADRSSPWTFTEALPAAADRPAGEHVVEYAAVLDHG